MNNYFEGKRNELEGFIPRDVRIVLEIGCGGGGFRSFFGDEVEYWGIELNVLDLHS